MVRLILCTGVIGLLTTILQQVTRHLPEYKAFVARGLLTAYLTANLGITFLIRLLHNLSLGLSIKAQQEGETVTGAIVEGRITPAEPDPFAPIVLGAPGSDWLAMKQGVGGIRRLWIYLNDPNTAIYYWFSCGLNLLLYMPLGMLIPMAIKEKDREERGGEKKKLRLLLITAFVLSAGTELLQLLTGIGRFDLMDPICNLAGAYTGFCLYQRMERNHKHP